MAQWTSKPTPERPYLQTSQQLHQQCGQKKDRIRHYFATTLRRATNLIHNTIQKIGSNPSLDEVIQLLDARHGLHEAYINMEDELDDFINFDTVFIYSPGFYTKLIALARTTGETVDEALSMSTEYLNNIGDVDDIFQESMMSCIELPSKIINLTSLGISIPRRDVQDLLCSKIRLRRILTRMENHWKNLLQEVQSRNDKVIFLELQNLVQTAQNAVESLPPCWDEGVRVPDASDDLATLSDAACAIDDIPTTEEREETASESCEVVTIMDQSGSNVATTRCTTQVYPAPNPPTRELDSAQPYDASRKLSRASGETWPRHGTRP